VTLRDLAEARQFKNGKRAVDRVDVEGRNSHADSPELPTPLACCPFASRAEWWLFGSSRRIVPD
jgi:hypothetical protein